MFKWIRTMILKCMMQYKARHIDTDVLMWRDDEGCCEFVLAETYSHSDKKKYIRFVTVNIKECVKEVEDDER